jgi:HlyD family secretion protein
LIVRLRGQTLPTGIVKAKGRAEARQVDISSKYPGQLAEISVDEGTKVTVGQVVARVSSPEFEAQLRAAQSDLQSAKDASAARIRVRKFNRRLSRGNVGLRSRNERVIVGDSRRRRNINRATAQRSPLPLSLG